MADFGLSLHLRQFTGVVPTRCPKITSFKAPGSRSQKSLEFSAPAIILNATRLGMSTEPAVTVSLSLDINVSGRQAVSHTAHDR